MSIKYINECKGCPFKQCLLTFNDRQSECPCIECLVKVMCSGHLKCKERMDLIKDIIVMPNNDWGNEEVANKIVSNIIEYVKGTKERLD